MPQILVVQVTGVRTATEALNLGRSGNFFQLFGRCLIHHVVLLPSDDQGWDLHRAEGWVLYVYHRSHGYESAKLGWKGVQCMIWYLAWETVPGLLSINGMEYEPDMDGETTVGFDLGKTLSMIEEMYSPLSDGASIAPFVPWPRWKSWAYFRFTMPSWPFKTLIWITLLSKCYSHTRNVGGDHMVPGRGEELDGLDAVPPGIHAVLFTM